MGTVARPRGDGAALPLALQYSTDMPCRGCTLPMRYCHDGQRCGPRSVGFFWGLRGLQRIQHRSLRGNLIEFVTNRWHMYSFGGSDLLRTLAFESVVAFNGIMLA